MKTNVCFEIVSSRGVIYSTYDVDRAYEVYYAECDRDCSFVELKAHFDGEIINLEQYGDVYYGGIY